MSKNKIILEVTDEQLEELKKYVENAQPEYKVTDPLKLLTLMMEQNVLDIPRYLMIATNSGLCDLIGEILDKKDCVMDGFVEEVDVNENLKAMIAEDMKEDSNCDGSRI